MKIAISTAFMSLVGAVVAVNVRRAAACDEAARFGVLTVSPSTFHPGDTININVDLTCGIQQFGIVPKFLDYLIEVLPPNNNGFELSVVLARHTFPQGALSDVFSVKVPADGFHFSAPYTLVMNNIAPANGSGSGGALFLGGTEFPINLIVD